MGSMRLNITISRDWDVTNINNKDLTMNLNSWSQRGVCFSYEITSFALSNIEMGFDRYDLN